MHIDLVLERLARLPSPLPPAPRRLDALVLSDGSRPAIGPTQAARARDAAALVLLHPDARGEAIVLLTVRPGSAHVHAGQVALPGGKREPGDNFPEGTALREAAEEVGLDPVAAGVRTMGRLETVDVRVSGFLMVPVLALAEREPALHAEPREVAEVLSVPLRHFLPDARVEIVEEDRDGWRLRYGAYPVAGHRVWGATAQVLGQLGAVLGGEADAFAADPGRATSTRARRAGRQAD